MTKLEPTRTSSDLTATERLRRMLDERGVEWTEGIARPELTQVRIDGKVVKFHPWQPNTLKVSLFDITPEQAIAATLGSCNRSNSCTNSERTGTRLPHFWTHDGTLHIEATRMPTRIVVCEGGTCEFVPKRELDASEAENAKLRELMMRMADALGIYSEWVDANWCKSSCRLEFECWPEDMDIRCPAWAAMRELGVEVDG